MIIHSIAILAVIFFLAFLTESVVEYIVGTPLDKLNLQRFKWLLMYISAGVGVFLAFWYQLDLINLLAAVVGETIEMSPVGYILTGLGIGRGANWLHQAVSVYFPAR